MVGSLRNARWWESGKVGSMILFLFLFLQVNYMHVGYTMQHNKECMIFHSFI